MSTVTVSVRFQSTSQHYYLIGFRPCDRSASSELHLPGRHAKFALGAPVYCALCLPGWYRAICGSNLTRAYQPSSIMALRKTTGHSSSWSGTRVAIRSAFRPGIKTFPQLPIVAFALGREPPLSALPSPCVCATVRTMVLQEGSRFQQVGTFISLSSNLVQLIQDFLLLHRSHRKQREAKIKREVKRGIREPNEQDPFEIFVTVTDIRYTYANPFLFPLSPLISCTDTIRKAIRF